MNLAQMDPTDSVKLGVERTGADRGMGGDELKRSSEFRSKGVSSVRPMPPPPIICVDDLAGGALRKRDTTGLGHG